MQTIKVGKLDLQIEDDRITVWLEGVILTDWPFERVKVEEPENIFKFMKLLAEMNTLK
jgi:hypothetical protein